MQNSSLKKICTKPGTFSGPKRLKKGSGFLFLHYFFVQVAITFLFCNSPFFTRGAGTGSRLLFTANFLPRPHPVKMQGAVAHATASAFVRIGVRIKRYQCPKQKHVQQIFSKIRNFRWICDAHAFLNCLIIRLILKMTAALSAKTMCNSPLCFYRIRRN